MEFYLHFNLDMGRSPGFGSNTTDFIRPIQTRSRCGSGPKVLNLASYIHIAGPFYKRYPITL